MYQQRPLNSLKCIRRIGRVGQNRLRAGVSKSFARACGRRRWLLRSALSRARTLLPFRASANFWQIDPMVLGVELGYQLRRLQRWKPVCEQQEQSKQCQLVKN